MLALPPVPISILTLEMGTGYEANDVPTANVGSAHVHTSVTTSCPVPCLSCRYVYVVILKLSFLASLIKPAYQKV